MTQFKCPRCGHVDSLNDYCIKFGETSLLCQQVQLAAEAASVHNSAYRNGGTCGCTRTKRRVLAYVLSAGFAVMGILQQLKVISILGNDASGYASLHVVAGCFLLRVLAALTVAAVPITNEFDIDMPGNIIIFLLLIQLCFREELLAEPIHY